MHGLRAPFRAAASSKSMFMQRTYRLLQACMMMLMNQDANSSISATERLPDVWMQARRE